MSDDLYAECQRLLSREDTRTHVMGTPEPLEIRLARAYLEQCEQLAAKHAEIERMRADAERWKSAALQVRNGSYLDDNVLNRHAFTTVSCEALRELFRVAGYTPEAAIDAAKEQA